MASLQQLHNERAETLENINVCEEYLKIEPGDADSVAMKASLEEQLKDLDDKIAIESAKQDALAPPPAPPTSDAPAKDHNEPVHIFNVKDVVMAKYSEDRQWYQATITSKTGSSTDPVYIVNFKGYGNTETKRKHEVRAMKADSKKRKAADDEQPAAVHDSNPAVPRAGAIISAAPSIDRSLVNKREPSKVSDGPTRQAPQPKKLKGSKALDKVQSNWKAWQATGPKKAGAGGVKKVNKESQFRIKDGPARVGGYVAPGTSTMQKDPTRSKWNKYDAKDEDEDD